MFTSVLSCIWVSLVLLLNVVIYECLTLSLKKVSGVT